MTAYIVFNFQRGPDRLDTDRVTHAQFLDPQFYVDHSALFHAGNVKTPTSLVHGLADERVPTSQGWEYYTALKKVGVPTDLLLLPRQPHGPREPKLLKAVQEWHLAWINKYTLGPAPAVRLAPAERAVRSEGKP